MSLSNPRELRVLIFPTRESRGSLFFNPRTPRVLIRPAGAAGPYFQNPREPPFLIYPTRESRGSLSNARGPQVLMTAAGPDFSNPREPRVIIQPARAASPYFPDSREPRILIFLCRGSRRSLADSREPRVLTFSNPREPRVRIQSHGSCSRPARAAVYYPISQSLACFLYSLIFLLLVGAGGRCAAINVKSTKHEEKRTDMPRPARGPDARTGSKTLDSLNRLPMITEPPHDLFDMFEFTQPRV